MMSHRSVSAPILMGEQPERVRRWTASSASASRGFGLGGVGDPVTPAWKH